MGMIPCCEAHFFCASIVKRSTTEVEMLPTTKLGMLRVFMTGQSARQIANEIGMPVRRLRAIEIGDHVPTTQERDDIARALGCDPLEVQP